jgi:hypothetical protein
MNKDQAYASVPSTPRTNILGTVELFDQSPSPVSQLPKHRYGLLEIQIAEDARYQYINENQASGLAQDVAVAKTGPHVVTIHVQAYESGENGDVDGLSTPAYTHKGGNTLLSEAFTPAGFLIEPQMLQQQKTTTAQSVQLRGQQPLKQLGQRQRQHNGQIPAEAEAGAGVVERGYAAAASKQWEAWRRERALQEQRLQLARSCQPQVIVVGFEVAVVAVA